MKTLVVLTLSTLTLLGCMQGTKKSDGLNAHRVSQNKTPKDYPLGNRNAQPQKDTLSIPEEFSRDRIKKNLEKKIANGIPLVIHIMVPLCDNDNQGIIPVPKALGNGLDLKTNLYWGALYGFKTHFKKDHQWTLEHTIAQPDPEILERVIFSRTYPNNIKVYLIGDAYRGDRMKACLQDYFSSLSGRLKDSVLLENGTSLKINAHADLIGFNGHNGLMDTAIDPIPNIDGIEKDAIAIACVSHKYFKTHLTHSKGYPFLMTTNLLAPEMYILSNVMDAWVHGKEGEEVELQAAAGYHKYQKCGLKGAKRLFTSGWQVCLQEGKFP